MTRYGGRYSNPASQAVNVETFALREFVGKWPSGSYLEAEGGSSSSALIADRAYFAPIWVPEARTSTEVVIETTVSGAGGTPTCRIGFNSPDTNGRPGALILDAGTIDVSVTAGLLTKAVSQAFTRGLVWVQIVSQGATVTQPTVRTTTGFSRYVRLTSATTGTGHAGYIQTGVSGALPASATPLAANAVAPPFIAIKAA